MSSLRRSLTGITTRFLDGMFRSAVWYPPFPYGPVDRRNFQCIVMYHPNSPRPHLLARSDRYPGLKRIALAQYGDLLEHLPEHFI